jgi:ankyrin repeat protein
MAVFLFWITIVFTPIVWYSVTTPASETTRADRDDNTLRDAILHDDIPTVRGMLARGVDPNYDVWTQSYADGQLPAGNLLVTAVSHGRVEAARLLIRHGADMGDENRSYSLLATAASDPSPEETPEFMPTGRKGGNIPMMRLLIQSGLHVNDSDGTSSALWAAVNSDMVDSVQFLLQHGANPNTRGSASNYMATSDGKMSVVHLSRCRGCIPITKMLKHAGANE